MQQDTLPPIHSNYLFFQTFWSNLFQILVNILPFIFFFLQSEKKQPNVIFTPLSGLHRGE